jgi:hypothetical protein
LAAQIITKLDALEFLLGAWHSKPAEIGFSYTAADLEKFGRGQLIQMAHDVADEIDRQRQHKLDAAPKFSPLGGLWETPKAKEQTQ